MLNTGISRENKRHVTWRNKSCHLPVAHEGLAKKAAAAAK